MFVVVGKLPFAEVLKLSYLPRRQAYCCSLEHLPIRPRVFLPVYRNGHFPRPHVLDELAVLGFGVIEARERVRVDVRRDVERGQGLVPADHERARDHAVVGRAEHGRAAEDVLARGFEAGEETAYSRVSRGKTGGEGG